MKDDMKVNYYSFMMQEALITLYEYVIYSTLLLYALKIVVYSASR